jgi:hypothetical protein
MQEAPIDERYQGVLIRGHVITAISSSFWSMDSSQKITGTALSLLWVHHAERTTFLGDGTITFNIVLILRNQSDYSNAITLMGTYSAKAELTDKTPERILLFVTEYLFGKAKEYVKAQKLTGSDGKDFKVPECNYTDDFLKREITWKFE